MTIFVQHTIQIDVIVAYFVSEGIVGNIVVLVELDSCPGPWPKHQFVHNWHWPALLACPAWAIRKSRPQEIQNGRPGLTQFPLHFISVMQEIHVPNAFK